MCQKKRSERAAACPHPRGGALRAVLLACSLPVALPATAASTDIANVPVQTSTASTVKPNIMLLLDDSDSMKSDYLPDDVTVTGSYGNQAPQCNGLAYDPAVSYLPPVKADGTSYPNVSFTSAPVDGYVATSAQTNLTPVPVASQTNYLVVYFGYYYKYSGTQPRLGWTYTTAGLDATTLFVRECRSAAPSGAKTGSLTGSAPGNTVFTRVDITTAADQQNYANWYSYYRTRILMMRSATGRAFMTLDQNSRVGFSRVSDATATTGTNNFIDTSDFDSTQKTSFYATLYGVSVGGNTPLRAGLTKIGQYYAHKAPGQTVDPAQYSCQRNYTILATDGYWNDRNGTQLDGTTAIGQQDGGEARPMFDGNYDSSLVDNTYVSYYWTPAAKPGTVASCSAYSITVQKGLTHYTDTVVSGVTIRGLTKTAPTVWDPVTTLACAATPSAGFSSNALFFTPEPVDKLLPPGTPLSTSKGLGDTLADAAEYYYKTDLRSQALGNCSGALGNDVCADKVPPNGLDTAASQHMTTSTIGLGLNGLLPYDPDYLNPAVTTGSYAQITAGTLDWPAPIAGKVSTVDDLWHAAVNGRGRYFSAGNVSTLSQALSTLLANTKLVTGAGAAAAVTSSKVQGSGNLSFAAGYTTSTWTGDVAAYPIDASTGAIDTSASKRVWSAQAQLDATAASSRTIYYRRALAANGLVPFNDTNVNVDYAGVFDNFCSKASPTPAQCAALTAAQVTLANNRVNLVAYLRGDAGYDAVANPANPLYRARTHKLGDIIDAAPVYVGKPALSYVDVGYSAFVSAKAARTPVVYAAANDGMLHAFSAATGAELWAYVPGAVMSKLYRLADTAYAGNHQYYVDGTPTVGDVVDSGGNWKTILVGGLGGGGAGYYALDITDPANPKSLWEFTDPNLGLSYGNPVITKRQDGTWVVALSSGYNNTSDGKGHLFLLDANAGTKLLDLSTTAGTPTSPSGLAKINAWVTNPTDNTALRFYGGDLLGNLWRFDIDGRIAPAGNEATLLATFQINASTPQPITVTPQPVLVAGSVPAVAVATGRYLGVSDIANTVQQSIYVVKDTLAADGLGDVRSKSSLVVQTVLPTVDTSKATTLTTNAVDWSSNIGWRVDLPNGAERVAVDPWIQGNTLLVASAVPSTDACTPGGSSWLYQLDLAGGSGSEVKLGDYLVVGGVVISAGGSSASGTGTGTGTGSGTSTTTSTSDGTGTGGDGTGGNGGDGTGGNGGGSGGNCVLMVRDQLGNLIPVSVACAPTQAVPTLRRASWRELVN